MHLFLTGVLPFLAHDHASAAAFLTCRYHNFHASIIPEFLSDEARVKSFCEARQRNQIKVNKDSACENLYNLFVQTPLMQFSPSLVLHEKDSAESILKPLLETKYFTRSLQRCSVGVDVPLTPDLLQGLSKVLSLTELDFRESRVGNKHAEIIVNSFPSLETLTIGLATCLDPTQRAVSISSPPPPATKTLRSLAMKQVDPFFAVQFVPQFLNLEKLELRGRGTSQKLDLHLLSSSLPLLTDLELEDFDLNNTESLKNLVHLSRVRFHRCEVPDLSFLTQENIFPHLTKLLIGDCYGPSASSFTSLENAPNLRVLEVADSEFNNDCFQYLESMVHLRKLDLSYTDVTGDSRSLKTLMQNLFQLEALNLTDCHVGNQGAIAGALYSSHSRLRILNLSSCRLVDDDLNGIGALKNTLEDLYLSHNPDLTNESLEHCRDLVKLKRLMLIETESINDLSPLKDCLNLEVLGVSQRGGLTDDSFKVFSEEPNSFPNLRFLDLSFNFKISENVFQHLAKNNHLVYQLTKLDLEQTFEIASSSATARKNICQLKGLRRLYVDSSVSPSAEERKRLDEMTQELKNLEEIL